MCAESWEGEALSLERLGPTRAVSMKRGGSGGGAQEHLSLHARRGGLK